MSDLHHNYSIILADPPWSYKDKAVSGNRGVEFKYATLNPVEIMCLPVKAIAAPDCALFLWVTMPLLETGLAVMSAWGFKYKTVAFTWVKTNKRNTSSLFWGMGNWTRANSELCLLGIRGKPQRIDKGVHSVVMSPIREHSAKPLEVRDRIVQLMGDLPRIELFGRDVCEGWDSLGNGIDGKDIREVLNVPSLWRDETLFCG